MKMPLFSYYKHTITTVFVLLKQKVEVDEWVTKHATSIREIPVHLLCPHFNNNIGFFDLDNNLSLTLTIFLCLNLTKP